MADISMITGRLDSGALTVAELAAFVRDGSPTDTSPLSACDAVAAGVAGAQSIRQGSRPVTVPPIPEPLRDYFEAGRHRAG